MAEEEIGVSAIIDKLRELLSNLSDDVIREEIFNKLDTDLNGGLSRSELRQALYNLGLRITINDLDDLMLYFDANGDGSISLEEFLRFRDAAMSAPETSSTITGVTNQQTRKIIQNLKNSLLGYGDEALKKLFLVPGSSSDNERLRELDETELYQALNQLGIRNLNPSDIHSILQALDANNDSFVSYEELSQFLDQEKFANGIRTLMSGAARYLRSRGSSLAKVLRKLAHESGSENGIELSSKALRTLFTERLRVPLSDGQLEAIIAMADLDGNGYCDVDEILYLANEEDDTNNGTNDNNDELNDTYRSYNENDNDTSQLDDYAEKLKNKHGKSTDSKNQQALNKYLQEMGNLGICLCNDMDEPTDTIQDMSNSLQNIYFSTPNDIDNDHQDYVSIGLSSYENIPLYSSSMATKIASQIDPTLILSTLPMYDSYCSLAWTVLTNMVYSRCALPATTAQTLPTNNAGNINVINLPSGIDTNRLNQILSTLGINTTNQQLFNALQRINTIQTTLQLHKNNTDTAPDNVLYPPPSANLPVMYSPPARIDYPLFRKILDTLALTEVAHKQLHMDPLVEARITNSLRYHAHTFTNNNSLASTYSSLQNMFITRTSLVNALLSIPGGYLSTTEAVAIATYAPGIYRSTCVQNLHTYLQNQMDSYMQNRNGNDDVQTRTNLRTPIKNSMLGETTETNNNDNHNSSGNTGYSSATYCLTNIYPTNLRSITGNIPPRDPDVNIATFINWLRTLAENGGGLQLLDSQYCQEIFNNQHLFRSQLQNDNNHHTLTPTENQFENKRDDEHDSKVDTNNHASDGLNDTLLFPVHRIFASLDPVARMGVRKLTSGCIRIPSPLSTVSLTLFTSSLNTTDDNNTNSKTDIPNFTLSSFLLWSHKLPLSFRPSMLAAVTSSHLRSSLVSHLLDGGFEQDTQGLTLRMTSILPGSADDPTVGCLPSFRTIPDRTTILRPIGGAGGVGGSSTNTTDVSWAAEGETVRSSPTTLLTALIQLSNAHGIPLPPDDQFRGSIVGRNIRISIMDASVPNSKTILNGLEIFSEFLTNGTSNPSVASRLRLLSNSFACPAGWENGTEDTWTVPTTPGTAPTAGIGIYASNANNGRILLRSDQPRDRLLQGGPAQAIVVFELTLVLAKSTTSTNNNIGLSSGGINSSSSFDSTAVPVRDSFSMEEITCAWGSIPLTTLVEKPGNHRIALTGGIPGTPMDIASSDIYRRRTGFSSFVAKTLAGTSAMNQGTVLNIQSIPLQKLKKIERINIGKLPLTIVTPYVWIPVLSNVRQLVADTILRTTFSHSTVPSYIGHNVSVTSLQNLLSLIGSNANNTSIGVLTRAIEIELNNKSNNSNGSFNRTPSILTSLGLRALPLLSTEGDGTPVSVLNGTNLDDTLTRTIFTTPASIAIDNTTISQALRNPGPWKPLNGKEQLIGI